MSEKLCSRGYRLLIAAATMLGLHACLTHKPAPSAPADTARALCRVEIEKRLSHPETAKFGEYRVGSLDGNRWLVYRELTAANALGVRVPLAVACEFEATAEGMKVIRVGKNS